MAKYFSFQDLRSGKAEEARQAPPSLERMIIKYPNVTLMYADHKDTWHCRREFEEIVTGKYGYVLSVGAKLHCIRYRGSNWEVFVSPTVTKIEPDGLWITAPMIWDEVKIWNDDHTEYKLKKIERTEPTFVPFKKWLPNGGVYRERDMYIVPCEAVYEKNKLSDVLAGNVTKVTEIKGDDDVPRRIEGIFYSHGGWRGGDKLSYANLRNFVKIEDAGKRANG